MKSEGGPKVPPLPLAMRCGERLKLTSHSVVVKRDGDGRIVQHETGWGPDPIAREGWSFSYTACWEAVPPAEPGPNARVPWPGADEAIAWGRSVRERPTPPADDAWALLFHHWITARLNASLVERLPDELAQALARAEGMLRAATGEVLPPEQRGEALPPEQRGEAQRLAQLLERFNRAPL
jgi:hypothetical protein